MVETIHNAPAMIVPLKVLEIIATSISPTGWKTPDLNLPSNDAMTARKTL
jgi:hypothetical protein